MDLSEKFLTEFMGEKPTKLKADLYDIALLNTRRRMLEAEVSTIRCEKNLLNKKIGQLMRLEKSHPCCQILKDGNPTIRIKVYTTETGRDYICDGCNETLKKEYHVL